MEEMKTPNQEEVLDKKRSLEEGLMEHTIKS